MESLSPGDVESISEGEIPEPEVDATRPNQHTQAATDEQNADGEPFEPILSDEEIGDDNDAQVCNNDLFTQASENQFVSVKWVTTCLG